MMEFEQQIKAQQLLAEQQSKETEDQKNAQAILDE